MMLNKMRLRTVIGDRDQKAWPGSFHTTSQTWTGISGLKSRRNDARPGLQPTRGYFSQHQPKNLISCGL